jgi:hypothetical protein
MDKNAGTAVIAIFLSCLLIGLIAGIFFYSVNEARQATKIAERVLERVEQLNSSESVEAYRAERDFSTEEIEKFAISVKYEHPRYDAVNDVCVSRPMVLVKYAKYSTANVTLFSEKGKLIKRYRLVLIE